jgi:hypothetical protein
MKREDFRPLADCSRLFLQLKKVYRYRLKKTSKLSDDEIIRACHFYVEENGMADEWESFREENEKTPEE